MRRNMAEIEIGILSRQCLDRRIPTPNLLQTEAVPFIIVMLVWLVVVGILRSRHCRLKIPLSISAMLRQLACLGG